MTRPVRQAWGQVTQARPAPPRLEIGDTAMVIEGRYRDQIVNIDRPSDTQRHMWLCSFVTRRDDPTTGDVVGDRVTLYLHRSALHRLPRVQE